jgi:hypothetical protein
MVFKRNFFIGAVRRSSGIYGYGGSVGPYYPGIRNTEEKFFGVGNVQITSFNTKAIVFTLGTLYGAV